MSQRKYFQTQKQETKEIELKVSGILPDWLEGSLIRNGPAIFETGKYNLKHWFDGFGMLHKFNIKNSRVKYKSKLIESPEYLDNIAGESYQNIGWGLPYDPCKSIFEKAFVTFKSTPSNTNVNVVKIGNTYTTVSDISTINEFNPKNLETVTTKTIKVNSLPGAMLAHPGFTKDKKVWNIFSSFSPFPKNSLGWFGEGLSFQVESDYNSKHTFYSHSFGNTEKYFIQIEQPLGLSFTDLMLAGIKNLSYYQCYKWDNQAKNILHVYNYVTKKWNHIEMQETFFVFHTINTFEKGEKLYMDICYYKDNAIVDDFYLDNLRTRGIKSSNKARFARITIDLKNQTAKISKHTVSFELPYINHAFGGAEYSFVYGLQSSKNSKLLGDSLVKYNPITKVSVLWSEKNLIPGEPVFVAKPKSKKEDEGILITICFDTETETSCLVVLNSETMIEVARSYAPTHIPIGLHGSFYKVS